MPLFGIEVSKYNGTINYTAAKNAGVRFAVVSDDSRFSQNVEGFGALGIPCAALHTLKAASVHEALSEADAFISSTMPYRCALMLPYICRLDSSAASPHLMNVFATRIRDTGANLCALYDGTDAFCDDELMMHTHTRTGQLVGVVGEFACAFGYAPVTRPILKRHADITDDILDYIVRYERGEYILARLADIIVAKCMKPLVNPTYERIVSLIRLSCRLLESDMAHLCASEYGEEIVHELYSAMVR